MLRVALFAVLALSLPLSAAAEDAPTRTLTVSGQGTVTAVPDMARLSLGARALDKTALGAMNQTSETLEAVLARLTELGLDPRDVQTSALRLDQRWRNGSLSKGQEFEGYEASNMLTIRVRDLDRLGDVLQAVLDDGANSLANLQFDVADPRPLQDEARRAAVRDAMDKARLYAGAAGVRLGPVLSITDSASPMVASRDMPVVAFAEAARVPVAAGEITLRGQVTIVFGLE
ncbi:SIMPL domain-containing protein [Pacificoceanicola onchidii]|uniref:SIMPL domain-containing protein n=1 Tax=Pacificoceanicola onchidii TaxID=2562685 RepID=UPI0010A4A960|nr:SIMPL domain-containing protein [Pacificoceanicola onchidii]